MFSRDRDRTHESGTSSGISPAFTTSSLCLFQRNLILGYHCRGRGINISGVDFWHAVEFSRNGRFLRTHPLGLSSGQFPFGLAFPTLPDRFPIRFPRRFPDSPLISRFPFPAVPTLSEVSGRSDRPFDFRLVEKPLWNQRFTRLTDTNPCRPDSVQFQATVRIYLLTPSVSTVFARRRGD